MLSSFRSFLERDRFLIGSSILRVCIGLLLLYNYLIHYNQKIFLWGNHGVNLYSPEFLMGSFSLYNWVSTDWQFNIVYHLGIAATLVYLIGYKGRLVSVINYIFFYSLYARMFQISDGGDNLLNICLFFLLFSNSTAYFSVDYLLMRKKNSTQSIGFMSRLGSISHNFAVFICIVQLCIVYFLSAVYQLMGEFWQSGTAIYYISQVDEFSRPLLRWLVTDFLWMSILVSYMSIFIKLAFPFSILNKKLKIYIVFLMVTFHLGIGVGMGLLSFSFVMIIFELLIFTDKEYLSFARRITSIHSNLYNRMHQRRTRLSDRNI